MSEYQAVRQFLLLPGEDRITVDTTDGIGLLQFECHNCNRLFLINPNVPAEAATVADLLKIQRADGKAYAYCDWSCMRSDANWFRRHPLVADSTSGQTFSEEKPSGIVITDAEFDKVEESETLIGEIKEHADNA